MQEFFANLEYSDNEDARGETKKVGSKIWKGIRKVTWEPVRNIICVTLIIALQIIRGILFIIRKIIVLVR